jgi:hypothetical protein
MVPDVTGTATNVGRVEYHRELGTRQNVMLFGRVPKTTHARKKETLKAERCNELPNGFVFISFFLIHPLERHRLWPI